jgi:hypothetical protein
MILVISPGKRVLIALGWRIRRNVKQKLIRKDVIKESDAQQLG